MTRNWTDDRARLDTGTVHRTNSTSLPRATRRPTASVAVAFPTQQPPGVELLSDEPTFDPSRHLQLEVPDTITTLFDLGYTEQDVAGKATTMAASSPFRVLSDEGAAILLDIAHRLEAFVQPAADRIERSVRGAAYRSRWLRDLCLSPEVAQHLADIYGCDIAPHAMPLHLGHMNFSPSSIDTAIDKWHHDTLPLDYVMMVTDPATVEGGRFEYFLGTKAEAAALAANGQTPPPERVVAPEFGGPGWAIALHGNMVVHRAAPLRQMGDRITMVNGYVATDPTLDDQSRTEDLTLVDDPDILYAEWTRYAAWRAMNRLQHVIDTTEFSLDGELAARQLRTAVADIDTTVDKMTSPKTTADHYGG